MIRFIAAVRSTLIVAAWLLGGPVLLFAVAGSPVPRTRPTLVQLETWLNDPLNPVYKHEAARTVAWIVWALFTIGICAVLAHQLRPGRWTRILRHLPPPVQSLTAAVLGTAAVTASTANPAVGAQALSIHTTGVQHPDTHQTAALTAFPGDGKNTGSGCTGAPGAGARTVSTDRAARPLAVAGTSRASVSATPVSTAQGLLRGTGHHAASLTTAATGPRHALNTASEASHHRSSLRAQPTVVQHPAARYRVVKGDNLWQIAESKLGDPTRWQQIYTLNRGHEQTNGYTLSNPDEIHIGWVLTLPARDAPPTRVPSPPANPAPSHHGTPTPDPGGTAPAPHTTPDPPGPGTTRPVPVTSAPSTAPATTASSTPARPPAGDTASTGAPATATPTERHSPATGYTTSEDHRNTRDEAGISLPSQGWVSLSLAALITTVASLLRLQHRRHARLHFPIDARIGAQPAPLPESCAVVDAVDVRHQRTGDQPTTPAVPAPIGLNTTGREVSLFDLPGPGLALTGDGTEPAARAVLAATLTTGATQTASTRPVVVTTTGVLARLLPAGTPLVGLDPDATSYDGERLIVLGDTAAAITHAEEEMIMRRRLLDTFDLDSITALNERTDHAETQPPYVLMIPAAPRHDARLHAVATHRAALDLHTVVLAALDGIPDIEVTSDGTTTGGQAAADLARMSTLAADDLAAVLTMLTAAAPRPESGHDIDLDPLPAAVPAPPEPERSDPVPAQPSGLSAPVRVRVLGPVLVETASGPVATGMRSGSYLILASLTVHPGGRTLEQLCADLHPDTNPSTAGNRVRTDISTTRRVLRTATGLNEPMFVVYDPATGRYRLDPELITVDLWQMLTAIETANNADDDPAALAALREAARLYVGDFADGHDHTWITDHASTYRHQILSVYARIAEILETDHPDQSVAALERAVDLDPVNEELYQRIMRIHGRAGRPDQVLRALRRLEERLADLGDAEPSEATRRVAERQLRPTPTNSGAQS